jgi:heme/copper-type cytochrome/quinol oxidase subunit 2
MPTPFPIPQPPVDGPPVTPGTLTWFVVSVAVLLVVLAVVTVSLLRARRRRARA